MRKRTEELNQTVEELRALNRELELRRQEAEFERLRAEAATKAKSEFLANMSHELRTPLHAIIGFTDLLLKEIAGPLNEAQREYLTDILESGRHLLSLIDDILDLSKIESGRFELELSTIDLKDLIEDTLIFFKEKSLSHNIKIQKIIDDSIGEIEADERKIKQVLLNLLSNAFKFTPDGGRITIEAKRADPEVIISVEDTGIGIKKED